MFKQYIKAIENKFTFSLPSKEIVDKSIFELSKKKGLIPEENTEKKEKEMFDECSYFIQTIEKTILDGVNKKEEVTRCNLNEKKMKHLKYEKFEKCVQYKEFQKSLENIGIRLDVYKGNRSPNTIHYYLIDKKIEVYH